MNYVDQRQNAATRTAPHCSVQNLDIDDAEAKGSASKTTCTRVEITLSFIAETDPGSLLALTGSAVFAEYLCGGSSTKFTDIFDNIESSHQQSAYCVLVDSGFSGICKVDTFGSDIYPGALSGCQHIRGRLRGPGRENMQGM